MNRREFAAHFAMGRIDGGYTGFSAAMSSKPQSWSGFSSKKSHLTLRPETATVT